MSLPYTVLGEFTGSVKSGSLLSVKDTGLFYVSQSSDVWFGVSQNDAIEVASYSTNDNTLQSWGTLYTDDKFQTVALTYLDNLNVPHSYTYNELVKPFTIYKNNEILLKPTEDLNAINVTEGSQLISYNFVREMAGSPTSTLTIKEISPSRTEIKLIPSGESDVQYDSFCIKKFPIRDVAPILLSIIKDLPYDKIYRVMSDQPQYQTGISFLKFMFFLPDDGSVVTFLRNLYEDLIKYTSIAPTAVTSGVQPAVITRIQGIKTYYNNFLLQSYDLIADFDGISQKYVDFVNLRLDERFGPFSNAQEQGYQDARQFCYDFFVTYFYDNNIKPLQLSYQDKYFGYLKNVLNFGNNRYFSILNNGYLDERVSPKDPITLIVKLSEELPSDISEKDTCWVSNFGMPPYVFTSILRNPVKYKTIKISQANFGSPQHFINTDSTNTLYSSEDLDNSSVMTNDIRVNKNIAELNTDYSDFSNFIVFSSATNRLNIFKNKMVSWTSLSASMVELDRRYNLSLSASAPYPYYFTEKANLQSQTTEIIDSFDGYESSLFSGGKYTYVISSGSFYSSSYVEDQDTSANDYDLSNRDSLLSNVPQFIATNSNYDEYLTFLNMVGHHFDNIYTYIAAMPIERQVKNELTSSIPTNTLKEMLYSFGWSVDDIIGPLDINEVYLNSMNSASFDALSGEQRLQTIWNRILVNLPGIYKTKGTEECVNFLMSCYGLPSSLITIREYGGTDYANDPAPTYRLDEKTYMLKFSGIGDYVEGPLPYSTRTVEFKFSIDADPYATTYPEYAYFPLFTSFPAPYTSSINSNWTVGFYRVPGDLTGRVIFQMGSGSSGIAISSSVLPIFNGEIFSVMLRRNEPDNFFESSIDPDVVPLNYDLTVQRNENGRQIFYSTSSAIFYESDNSVFSQFGKFRMTNGTFKGTLDKLSIWDIPINDNDFQEHVNDLNSYGSSGSIPYQNLWVQLSWQYPQTMYAGGYPVWITNASDYYTIPNYYTDTTLTAVDPALYSASLAIIEQRWQTYYPTGSINIFAYNFPPAIGSAFSASWEGYPTCSWVSQSSYPYHFKELTYQQDIDASKYGPNKYKNRKIRKVNYEVDARFDSFNRSTSEPDLTVSGESNQLGFFIDPQDSKNKDILRYVGRSGIMELIGDPANLYSDKYYDLINKNDEYNSQGEKRTYFNEMLTVYKFYFDKSIFKAIRNVLPARANVYTGVIIEPTILERPKYPNKPLTSSVQISYQYPGVVNNIYEFDMSLISANFNTDWNLVSSGSATAQERMTLSLPANYDALLDMTYLTEPVRSRPNNLEGGYIPDYMDTVQHDFYPDFTLPRNWETSSTGPLPASYTVPINGSVTSQNGNNPVNRFVIGPDHGVDYARSFFSGSNQGNHPILYYMMKVWDRYYYYAKTGEYVRSTNLNNNPTFKFNFNQNGSYFYSGSVDINGYFTGSILHADPNTDAYDSASIYLYKYVIFDERYMRNLIYFTDLVSLFVYDSSSLSYTYNSGINSYLHKANTFLGTPDQTVSNISASANAFTPVAKTLFDLNISPVSQYFEMVSGYPRNHYTHKLQQFSKSKYGTYTHQIFVKGKNTTSTTVDINGINDGTYPVTQFNTSNMNVVNSSNVIQNIPSSTAGTITPNPVNVNVGGTIPVGVGGTPPITNVTCVPLLGQKYTNPNKKTKKVFNLKLGSKTGTVKLAWDARGAKDRFVLNWNGQDVIDTKCVKHKGSATFYKSTATPTSATLTITSCDGSSSGFVSVHCPE